MTSTVLTLRGEFDLALRPSLTCRLAEALRSDSVAIDGDGVTYIDAGSLRLIDQTRLRLTARGGRFEVIRTSATFDLISDLAGFPHLRGGQPAPGGASPVSDPRMWVLELCTDSEPVEGR